MLLIRLLLLVFIAAGIGLLGGAALDAYESFRVTHLAGATHATGTVTGSHSKVTKVRKTYGRGYDERSWFPQAIVSVVDIDGKTLEAIDPNSVPFMIYKSGDSVPVVIIATPDMRQSGVTQQIYIDDLYTRYAFPAIVSLAGMVFVILPIPIHWSSRPTGRR